MRTFKKGDKGSDIKEIQAMLKKIGLFSNSVSRNFESITEEAVIQFQIRFGLNPDGIIGPQTYKVMERFLKGYDNYRIKAGDTLYNIAERYYTNLSRIFASNPGLDPYNLNVGDIIVVPFGIDVVDTNVDYTYEIMERDIKGLKVRYPFIDIKIAGQSVLGKNLYYIKLGSGKNKVFYNGAHHGPEWITTPLLMKFTENFLKSYVESYDIEGYNPRQIWKDSTIYIMPMVNPDGVNLVIDGLSKNNPFYENLIKWNSGSTNFSDWKANIKGIDLNHNYDAAWEKSKESENSVSIQEPGPTNYAGEFPVSEPETQAVVQLTNKIEPKLILAYHAQGEVIYWNFENLASEKAFELGKKIETVSGYKLEELTGITSYAGYKEWFIQEFGRPGYTIEVGKGVNPLPLDQFNKIYSDNIEVLLMASMIKDSLL